MDKEMSHKSIDRAICPFVLKPFENCYCASTSSLCTEATIHYCGGNFEKCEIYESHVKEQG